MMKVKRFEDTEKKENINIMMCPEERFVLNRIIRVNGRIR